MAEAKRTIALIGANGMLARKVREQAAATDELVPLDLPEFDISDRQAVLERLSAIGPDVIINCAAFTQVDRCEEEEALATRVNGAGPGFLAEAALNCNAALVHISTDYVFSGDSDQPYSEDDPTGPLSAYGRSKLNGEQAILASGLNRYLIIRSSWLFGPGGPNFVETVLRLAAEREELRIVADQVGSPTYTGDLARAIYLLLDRCQADPSVYGIYHFSNIGRCSWYEFAEKIVTLARELGLPVRTGRVMPIETHDYPLPAARPQNSQLSKARYLTVVGETIPLWHKSLKQYLNERQTTS